MALSLILVAGYAQYGVPGYANTSNDIGDEPGEMPPADVRMISLLDVPALPPHPIDDALIAALGAINVTHIACGEEHVCALTSTGEVYCWGAFEISLVKTNPDVLLLREQCQWSSWSRERHDDHQSSCHSSCRR